MTFSIEFIGKIGILEPVILNVFSNTIKTAHPANWWILQTYIYLIVQQGQQKIVGIRFYRDHVQRSFYRKIYNFNVSYLNYGIN